MHPFQIELTMPEIYRRLEFSMDANCQFYKSSYDGRVDRDTVPQKQDHLRLISSMKMDLRQHAIRDCCHGIHSICTTEIK